MPNKLHQAAEERGRRLAEMDEKGERMKHEAEMFNQRTNALLEYYKNKKWYYFW